MFLGGCYYGFENGSFRLGWWGVEGIFGFLEFSFIVFGFIFIFIFLVKYVLDIWIVGE